MTVKATLVNNDTEMVIRVEGRFDFTAANDFRNCYRNYPIMNRYTLDLSRVEFMDSAAIGMLLLLKEFVEDKGKIRIVNPNEAVKKVIVAAHVERFIDIAA